MVAPAGASRTGADDPDGVLSVATLAFGDTALALIQVASADAVAGVTLSAPAGYTVDLDEPVGARIGDVSAGLSDVPGTTSSSAEGLLVVDDPARYAGRPNAEACAPGPHAAVWRTTLSVLGQTFELPIYVDRGNAADPSAPSLVLRFCPVWPSAVVPAGVTAHSLTFFVERVLRRPTAPGRYRWNALVTPPLATLAADPSRTFEVRAVEPIPHALTLRTSHDAKAKTVVLSGKLTAAGEPEPGVEVSFAASTNSFSEVSFFGPVKTNAAGEFSIKRRVDVTTQFSADASSAAAPCTPPSAAPAGCALETVSAARGASAIVRVRLATDPKLAVRLKDQALARRINLKLGDFPAGWEVYDSFSVFDCRGFRPRLSDLTATGDVESRIFASEEATAGSRATLYSTEAQARAAFGRSARVAAVRCVADEAGADGYTVLQLGPIPFRPLGSETKAFRVVLSRGEFVFNLDLVSFRRGRAVVRLGVGSVTQPLLITEELAGKLAARAGRG